MAILQQVAPATTTERVLSKGTTTQWNLHAVLD